MHRTHTTDLFLRVRSKPIIEHSTGIRVAPWAAHVAPEPRVDALLQVGRGGGAGLCPLLAQAGRLRGGKGAAGHWLWNELRGVAWRARRNALHVCAIRGSHWLD